jgi:uncharacterized protein (TIGR02466 family)
VIDYGKMVLFPVPIYTAIIPDFNDYKDDIIEYTKQYRNEYETMTVSNVSGYQSSSDIHQDIKFKDICDKLWGNAISPGCDVMVKEFAENGYPNTTFDLHNIWFNCNQRGAWNMPHTHPHCFYSGVIWVQSSDGCGELVMQSPHAQSLFGLEPSVWALEPEEGRVVLFPSNIQHTVNANRTDEERISLSFNIAIDIP